ncbi:MAG: response regulator transcription factor [Firmicutes bacterium]|nr:response regulator transcription factor [Bacillota bacterium]MCL5038534.1 response regulator transcription factor [Bacillota bacterium]
MLLNAQGDMEVIGEASDGDEALEKARILHPDVILMDLSMPFGSGLEATRRITSDLPDVKVLVLTMHDDEGYLRQALEYGASGYIVKSAADLELISAIRAVQRGGVAIDPGVARGLVKDLKRGSVQQGMSPPKEVLSPRESEVLRMIALGYTLPQTAQKLGLSVKTIETHKAHLMEKLHLRSRSDLVRYAIKNGLVNPE